MKKLFKGLLLTAIVMLFGISACAESGAKPQLKIENGQIVVENAVENGKLIVAYYNQSGVLVGVRNSGEVDKSLTDATNLKAFYWNMETIEPLSDNMISLPLSELETPTHEQEDNGAMKVIIGNDEYTAVLENNETAVAFAELLPMTVNMTELNGNEKYYIMDKSLPSDDERVGTIHAGDIMLYSSRYIVVFYKTFNTSYSYTKIGHIENPEGIEEAAGNGGVTVSFSAKGSENNDNSYSVAEITLNSGYTMSVLGLGTWTQNDETTANSVYYALKDGYRLIDTAQYYGNEKGVGEGVRKAIDEGIVTRDEVFITSKVMPTNYDNAYASISQSNNKIGLDYIDLMLIHQSGSNDKQVYRALEQAVKDGTIKSLGISNYYTQTEFDRITEGAEIMPAVVQNENHPFYQNTDLQKYVKQYGTVVESYYPLGGRGHTQDLLGNKTINEIAKAHNKTAAQIILRWHIQAGYITIPGSRNPDHIAENYDIFDFEMTEDEMRTMAALDAGNRYESW